MTVSASLDSKNGQVVRFSVSGIPTEFANLLRRYIMSEVPTIAIDKVVFYDNSSSFIDEYIAHRIGQIPITTPDKVSSSTEYVFVLDVSGPGKAMSFNLESQDSQVKPALGEIPIVPLMEGQIIRAECKAVVGLGRNHAKFQPALATYGMEDDGSFSFRVEGFYNMPVETVVLRALEIAEKDFSSILEQL